MFLNVYQRYISELIDEYHSLLKRQLLILVNRRFGSHLPNLDGYLGQMCRFGDVSFIPYGSDAVVLPKGCEPDYTIIRSMEVMLQFLQHIARHGRGKGDVSIRFSVTTPEAEKEICIIPVQSGLERQAAAWVGDRFTRSPSQMVIFLLDSKEQMQCISADCSHRFAVVTEGGVAFYKK